MIRLEFLLEEPSMANVLTVILPKILPEGYRLDVNYFLRPHSGKADLKKSIPKKMRAFSYPNYPYPVIMIILHDQHSHDCIELKRELSTLCKSNSNRPYMVRIVCRGLESWYLGDMKAIEAAYPTFKSKKYKEKKKFRNPDNCIASEELSKILPVFQKIHASKNISVHLDTNRNTSPSFNHFVSGLHKTLEAVRKKLTINDVMKKDIGQNIF